MGEGEVSVFEGGKSDECSTVPKTARNGAAQEKGDRAVRRPRGKKKGDIIPRAAKNRCGPC